MKKLIINSLCVALALACQVSYAKDRYVIDGQQVGSVVLTDEPCISKGKNYKSLLRSYIKSSDVNAEGCWFVPETDKTAVKIIWNLQGKGVSQQFNVTDFEQVDYL